MAHQYNGDERRANGTIPQRLAAVEMAVDELRIGLGEVRADVGTNIELTQRVADDTEQIRILWGEARAAFRLFNRISAVAKWTLKYLVLPLAVLLASLYAWTHGGQAPAWLHELMELAE